jgi:hypothetical protein
MALIRLAVIVAVGLVLEPIAAEAQPAAKVGRIDYLTQTEDRRGKKWRADESVRQ